ncbi:MAG: B12-binding domain-containing radical SAM protein [Planctomycetota bacterium]|nr:MAG: B12-binding domain-containing radical SAM protein [Planctomycetota bacterium]
MLRIQLIHPPAFLNPTALTALRPSLPLGLAYVAASLRKAGHEVSVIDAVGAAPERTVRDGKVARLGLTIEQIVERITPDTQVVGITSMFTYSWRVVRELIEAVKRARPDVLVLGGGEHFTGLPEFSLRESPIDICALGEGEETAVECMRRYESWLAKQNTPPTELRERVHEWADGLPGVAYMKAGEPVIEARRDRVRDIDEIPNPAWDLFEVAVYDANRLVNGIKFGVTMPILATRGCPYRCNYCSSPNMWTTKWVARDAKLVVDEIEHYVRTYGANNFPFQDLTAIVRKDWIVAFATELIERDLKITWQLPSGTRCEVVDDEVSSLLRRSGGRSLNFAPESGSEAVRKKVRKQMKEESLFKAVDAALAHKLNISAFFVMGFPGDTVEDLKQTVKWAGRLGRLGIDDVAVGFYFPIPGTTFFRELEEQGKAELTEDLMLAPIFVHDSKLRDEHNYSQTLSSRTLTYWRYRTVYAFYWRAFLLHPTRGFRILGNLLRGREESKMDSFMQILKERFFTKRAAKA